MYGRCQTEPASQKNPNLNVPISFYLQETLRAPLSDMDAEATDGLHLSAQNGTFSILSPVNEDYCVAPFRLPDVEMWWPRRILTDASYIAGLTGMQNDILMPSKV